MFGNLEGEPFQDEYFIFLRNLKEKKVCSHVDLKSTLMAEILALVDIANSGICLSGTFHVVLQLQDNLPFDRCYEDNKSS